MLGPDPVFHIFVKTNKRPWTEDLSLLVVRLLYNEMTIIMLSLTGLFQEPNEMIYIEFSYKLSHMVYILQICNITQIQWYRSLR